MIAVALASPAVTSASDPDRFACAEGMTLSTGEPDLAIFSREASRGVRGHWCESYDESGLSRRFGPYWERYPSGALRSRARYSDSRLEGPVVAYHESGALFLRGFLEAGRWSGPLEIFHENGAVWFQAHVRNGKLDGAVRTLYDDGSLESETRFQSGREDGLARSFYPSHAGGRLKSEAHVEADTLVGQHRLLGPDGALRGRIDWDEAPDVWRRRTARAPSRTPAPPATPASPPAAGSVDAPPPVESSFAD